MTHHPSKFSALIRLASTLLLAAGFSTVHAESEEVGCVTTTWKLIGANHRVCVSAYERVGRESCENLGKIT